MSIGRSRGGRVDRLCPFLESPALWYALPPFRYDGWPVPEGIEFDVTDVQALLAETAQFLTPEIMRHQNTRRRRRVALQGSTEVSTDFRRLDRQAATQ